jgi:hypothetical protein
MSQRSKPLERVASSGSFSPPEASSSPRKPALLRYFMSLRSKPLKEHRSG